ncbi:MAG: thioredoxin domain-containing protein [Acidimicrobiales bacterium]
MLALVVLLVVGLGAGAVAWYLQRSQRPEPERGPSWVVPSLLDRDHFERPDAPWLVAVFSSSTCLACADVREKAAALASDEVAVVELDAVAQRDLHERYGIDAVPMVLVADAGGIVRRDFVGPVTATDLWAAVAELREPGSVPPGCDGTVCG